ncbi:hypothetical protein HYPDE_24548 [Hyphomicrobium denitrificans 1NES1]|uniref:Uncharacterized protein n=1 Tax=Hyphomicrobium denitrificans 1NES1 TaxID=670307 RepID=N0B967_9HYPH|nr:hypothetical protein HYPDE_24548 [Hyphomicrobium denitrificans 1NES1]
MIGAAVVAPDNIMAEAATNARARFLMNPPDLPDKRAPASSRWIARYDKYEVAAISFLQGLVSIAAFFTPKKSKQRSLIWN